MNFTLLLEERLIERIVWADMLFTRRAKLYAYVCMPAYEKLNEPLLLEPLGIIEYWKKNKTKQERYEYIDWYKLEWTLKLLCD